MDLSSFKIFHPASELFWFLDPDGKPWLLQQLDVFCPDGMCKGEVIPSTEGKRPRYRHWVLGNEENRFQVPFENKNVAIQFALERKGMRMVDADTIRNSA